MTYVRHKRLPDLGERIDIAACNTENDILKAAESDFVVLVADVLEGSFDHIKYKDKSKDTRFASIVLENLTGYEKPMSLERPLWPNLTYLDSNSKSGHRVVCLVKNGNRVTPINIVKSRYTVLQNRFVIRDALTLLKTSRGSAKLVSAGSHLSGRLFSIQFVFDVLDIQIEDKKHFFHQHATLYTSHDSSQAYSLAFGQIGESDNYYSAWTTLKIRHTPKMQDHATQVRKFLEGCDGAEKSFIAEVSSLGKIALNPNSAVYSEILHQIIISEEKSQKFDYDRRKWEFEKVTAYFIKAAEVYGFNAWSLYTALNEFSFKYINKMSSENPLVSLRSSEHKDKNKQFEMQNKLKKLLLSESLGLQV